MIIIEELAYAKLTMARLARRSTGYSAACGEMSSCGRGWRKHNAINAGSVIRMSSGASAMPPTTTTASGFCTCDPMPEDSAAGSSPTPAMTQVISTGRICSSPVRNTAASGSIPSRTSWLN